MFSGRKSARAGAPVGAAFAASASGRTGVEVSLGKTGKPRAAISGHVVDFSTGKMVDRPRTLPGLTFIIHDFAPDFDTEQADFAALPRATGTPRSHLLLHGRDFGQIDLEDAAAEGDGDKFLRHPEKLVDATTGRAFVRGRPGFAAV